MTWRQHLPATSLPTQHWQPPSSPATTLRSPQRPLSLLPVFVGPCPPPRAGSGCCWWHQDRPLPTAEGSLHGHKDLSAHAPRLLEGSCFHLPVTFPPHSPGPPTPGRNTQLLFFIIPGQKLLLLQLGSKARSPTACITGILDTLLAGKHSQRLPSTQNSPFSQAWGRPSQEPLAAPQGYSKGRFQLLCFSFLKHCMHLNMPCLFPKI